MLILLDILFKRTDFKIYWSLLFLLVDVSILTILIYLVSQLGIYLTPFYLVVAIAYAKKFPSYYWPIAAICVVSFVSVAEFSTYWEEREILSIVTLYALMGTFILYGFSRKKSKVLALTDPLTKLPNRTVLNDRLQLSIDECKKTGLISALLFMDLDGFKQVNDTLGHNVGDSLLIEVAARLRGAIKEKDTLARLGGDEFAIIVRNLSSVEDAVAVAERVLSKFDNPYKVNDRYIDVGVSIGIALCPQHSDKITDLFRYSDVAMYAAKRAKSGYVIYCDKYNQSENEKLALMTELRAAIKNDLLELMYQPKKNLSTGKVESLEALVRWNHETMGQVPPSKFIELAEGTVLINELTEWVINTSFNHCAEWQKVQGNVGLSINITARNLQDEKIMVQILAAIERNRMRADSVTLEVTETSLVSQTDMAIKNLVGLNMMGVRLSIDDFGTGHASLMYVQKLPIKEIKIDQEFISKISRSTRDRKITQSIIHLAHDIDCVVVAEGVESEEVCKQLQEMGCDIVQGYFISNPMSISDTMKWLSENDA